MTKLDEVARTAEGSTPARRLAAELRATLTLAGPVVVAELSWMAMGVADLIMVGPLGPEAIGAVGIGNILYFTVAIFGYGLLLGLDTLVAQAFGAGRSDDCHRWLWQGVWLSLLITPPLMLVVELGTRSLGGWGLHPDVARATVPYLRALNWGTGPLLVFTAFRRYLQARNLTGAITFAMIAANVVNVAANWVLVYGHLGAPALGVAGSAWSTCLARAAMAAMLAGYAIWQARRDQTGLLATSLRLEWTRLRQLVALGVPAALQITLEVAVFAVAAAWAGQIGPTALAAHEIVLHACGLTFMVPLGVSAAAAVRVGQAVGRDDPAGARRAGWSALLVGGGFMTCAGLAFLTLPRSILAVFNAQGAVAATGVGLLFVAAFFQMFDGLQIVATGALRGLGDTRTPLVCNSLAHWGVGLPVGYILAFPAGLGVFGLWVGLSSGLIAAGAVLLGAWAFRSRGLGVRACPS